MALTGYERPLDQYSKNELVQIAKYHKIYYQSESGVGKLGGYEKLTKEKLLNLIQNDADYNRDDPNRSNNRFLKFKGSLSGKESPEELMDGILSLAQETRRDFPISGKYYTYIYYAATPNIRYDRHPLIIAGNMLPKGFLAFNHHWGKIRQYNTVDGDRLVSGLYEITVQEFNTLKSVPYGKIIYN